MDKEQKKDSDAANRETQKELNVSERPDEENVKTDQQLTKEDLPDITNESKGNT